MKIGSSFSNFIIAVIYAAIYDYVYGNYMYGLWISYVDGSYTPMTKYNFTKVSQVMAHLHNLT